MQQQDYPDVLGAITGGARLEMETLQCALGVFPAGTAIGQPFEVVVILQSMIARPQEVVLALRLPRRDALGHQLTFQVLRPVVRVPLGGGEVGVVHLPVIPRLPTPPAQGYPLILRVVAPPVNGPLRRVRAPGAGLPPDRLPISPVRLEVLREIPFHGDGRVNRLHGRFDVIPGYIRPGFLLPAPHYHVLWTAPAAI